MSSAREIEDSSRIHARTRARETFASILRAKEASFTLDDVRVVVTTTPATRSKVLRRQRDELKRAHQLRASATRLIETALGCRHGVVATCPHFQELLAEYAESAMTKVDPVARTWLTSSYDDDNG